MRHAGHSQLVTEPERQRQTTKVIIDQIMMKQELHPPLRVPRRPMYDSRPMKESSSSHMLAMARRLSAFDDGRVVSRDVADSSQAGGYSAFTTAKQSKQSLD